MELFLSLCNRGISILFVRTNVQPSISVVETLLGVLRTIAANISARLHVLDVLV